MCDRKLMTLVIIITVFFECSAYYSPRYTFQNVTVHLKVSNAPHQWKTVFVPQGRNIHDFLDKAEAKVKIISFRNQKIPILLKNSVNNLTRIKKIKINSCGVADLEPGFLRNVTRIFEFDLSKNQIRDIRYGVFTNTDISRLYLNSNKIHEISRKAFNNMTNLEMIVLSNNRLTTWDPIWFLKTPVRHVDFSSNMIEELPPNAFEYFKEFKKTSYGEYYYINFNNNVLTQLRRKSLPDVPFLWFLFLENNFIEDIEKGFFEGIEKMEVLKLGQNSLTTFENEILGEMDLRYLKLNNNFLKAIDVNITEILNIEDNPLDVECKRQWDERKKRDRDVFERYFYD